MLARETLLYSPLQVSSILLPPFPGGRGPVRLSFRSWEAVIEKRRSSATQVHQFMTSLNSRETTSCVCAQASWLKPFFTGRCVASTSLQQAGGTELHHTCDGKSPHPRYEISSARELVGGLLVAYHVDYLFVNVRRK